MDRSSGTPPPDAIVIGGGFFGCSIACYLAGRGVRVLVLEEGADLLERASYANQARVHNGYHYPRAILTALRSRVNYPRFRNDYPGCIVSDFEKYYAIATTGSKVTAGQFRAFCRRIGAPLEPAPPAIQRLLNPDLIEEVFHVEECAFDALKLRLIVRLRMLEAGVSLRTHARVRRIEPCADGWTVVLEGGDAGAPLTARWVFNCTYAQLNRLLRRSGLPLVPLKHEMTEMAVISPPAELARAGMTVMCGPFFSTMPFPPNGLHTLSHVRYTPHYSWRDDGAEAGVEAGAGAGAGAGEDGAGGTGRAGANGRGHAGFDEAPRPVRSRFPEMIKDAARYLPAMSRAAYRDSIWEVKTVLPRSELDDSRPILFVKDHGAPNLYCIMGGKIDNIYDVYQELDVAFPGGVAHAAV